MFLKFILKTKHIFLLILISSIYLFPIFINGFFLSHDSITHTARGSMYYEAISGGDFFPRWARDANFGFGSPLFIFYYPLTGYLIALPHFLGISFETSFLLTNILAFIIGPVFFYLWTRRLFNSTFLAFISAVFFMVLPYRFLTMYVRSGIGELLAFSILPLLFYFIEKFSKKIEIKSILSSSLVYALIILSHNGVSLIFTPIFVMYSFLKGRKIFIYTLISIFFGLGISAYFWIPAFFESRYTNGLFYFGNMFKEHFASIFSFIVSSWGFGPDVNKPGGLSPQIGIFGFLVVIVSLGLLFKRKFKGKTLILFWLTIFLLGLFIPTEYSSFIWEKSDFLKKFQFPWRFIMVSSFAAAALLPFVLQVLKNRGFIIFLIFLIALNSLQFAKVQKTVSFPDSYYIAYEGSTSYHNEDTTRWLAGEPSKRARGQVQILSGDGTINDLVKLSKNHSFKTNSTSALNVLDSTIYFPGWEVYVDKEKIPIQFQDPSNRGLITFAVPKGEHNLEVRFAETKIRLFSDIISLASIALFALLILFRSNIDKKNLKKLH